MFLGLFGSVAPALVYWYGGHEVISGNISAGEVVGFALLIGRIFTPVTQLLSVWVTVQSSLALFERVFDYGDLPREIADAPDARPLEHVAGHVVYDHVSFSYGKDITALDDVSMDIPPGHVAALVGRSGAGKTTLTYLLPRLYDVNAGKVMIDGKDIRSVTLDSLSSAIGVVTQEPYLFHATIRDNIRYARPDASDDDVRRAAHAAYIDEFVDALPYGYETIVGERGLPPLRRREAARGYRARGAEGSADPDPRRSDVVPRFAFGAHHPTGARRVVARPDDADHRAPVEHGTAGGCDLCR